MDFLMSIWSFFATNILTQPAYFIGLMVLVGYLLLKKPLYEAFAGFIKATVGYMILAVGSGGLVNNFRPILVGLKDRFNLDAMVIDPYFGQNAVTAGLGERFGRTFSQVMLLLLIAFIMNLLLVRLKKWTKMRAVFRTCTDAAGFHRFLADSVLLSNTGRYTDSDPHGSDSGPVLGSRLQSYR